MTDISKKVFIWVIVGLILLRIVLIILVMNNIPFTDMRDDGFRPAFTESYQPDEWQYFQLTKGLILGKAEKLVPNIGAPLVFAPLLYFAGADSVAKLAPYVFIFQAFLLFSLAIILVAFIGYYLFNSRTLALASVSLFVIYPWLLLGIFKFIGYDNAIAAFHYQLWIFTLSDYLSAFWVYLSFFLIFKWFGDFFESSPVNWKKLAIVAAISGAALLTRVGNFWLILVILTAFLYFRQFKKIAVFSFFLTLAYLPQLIFNAAAFGAPWIFGYRDPLTDASTHSMSLFRWFHLSNLWFNFKNFSPNYYLVLFAFAGVFLILVSITGFKYLKGINKAFAIITMAWLWPYLLFYWLFDISLSQLRYFLPAIPAFIYLLVASMLYFVQKVREKEYV